MTPPAPVVTTVPDPPAAPLDRPSPYDDRVPRPPLFGLTSTVELTTLQRTSITYTFEGDVRVLSELDPAVLLELLAAAPEWRVARMERSVVALRRNGDDPPAVSRTGYHLGETSCWRVALRFGDADTPWRHAELVSQVQATDAELAVTAFTPRSEPCKGQLATAFRASGVVALEVFESGAGDDRPETIEALGVIPHEISQSLKRAARPPWPYATVDGADVHAVVELLPAVDGQLELRAQANPGAPGWTWVRILDGALAPWEEDAVGVGTVERVGWSVDPTDRFYLQGTFPVPSGEGFTGTAELWFQADGGAPTALDAIPITVPAR